MNTAAQDRLALESRARGRRLPYGTIAIWLGASLIAGFFALVLSDSAVLGEMYLPRTNDSFYHARRILDAAVGTRGFYQFDERLHVPDGAWISWPWAYDYLLAKAAQVALWVWPSLDPMAFIAYVPVAWILVNAALFMAALGTAGVSSEMRVLGMFCFAFSPLTQLLHSIGMVDHHFIEHTFVLLNVWLGLRWFKQPADTRKAAALAVVLGIATAFHNGLFVLQLFVLITVFILWLRAVAPAPVVLRRFGVVLVISTLVSLLPSEPFRNGMFEFGLHSWFHLYVAVCTASVMTYMAWLPASRMTFGGLIAFSAALAVPLGTQLVGGAGFLSGTFSILDQITEVQSPYRMATETYGVSYTASYYSWLLVLAPAVVAFYTYRLFHEAQPERIFFAVAAVLGITLLLNQMRLHYFGYFALVASIVLAIDELRARRRWHRGFVFVGTFAALVVAFQPPLRDRLLIHYAPSADPEYASAFSLFVELNALCAEDPGTVLASNDDGSAVLFHSECGVIANNFILRPEDKAHVDEVTRLMQLTPEQIRAERPDVKYLLLRTRDFSIIQNDVAYLVSASPIAKQLFIDPMPPPGYQVVKTVHRGLEGGGHDDIYARLFKVVR